MNRRTFLKTTGEMVTALASTGLLSKPSSSYGQVVNGDPFSFRQIDLPYAYDALEPYIDAETMRIHYNKHHRAYVEKINKAITRESIRVTSDTEFFQQVSTFSDTARNNGGGAFNHNLFFRLMKPNRRELLYGKMKEVLEGSYGSVDQFKEKFTQAAMAHFGSGWVWLIDHNGKLRIGSTPNQDNPLMSVSPIQGKPLLALDVWEHAYYLKYQNQRSKYVANWWNVINWEAVADQLG